MRDIKFRAWNPKFKKMEYDVWPTSKDTVGHWIKMYGREEWQFSDNGQTKVIIEQYTGRKDKNSAEIYANDQIAFNVNKKFGTDNRYEGRIYLCEKRLAYCVECLPAWDMPIYHNLVDIEVIGNIHQEKDNA